MKIAILGLSITSSWGNGHATTYRALVSALAARGHAVLFLERDVPWYAAHRDLPRPTFCDLGLYDGLEALDARYGEAVRDADLAILGSYVPDGIAVGAWMLGRARGVRAFYDIDTPVTLAALARGDCPYLDPDLIPRFALYLSFTGGPTLDLLETRHGARRARPLYCAVERARHYPEPHPLRWDLGYMGTYSPDRQPILERLLLAPARALPERRFVVAGPQYPPEIAWPENVERIEHLPPDAHRSFYNAQRFTLNVTRADMVAAGYSPSVRLFEAAACATPVIGDRWPGLDSFFRPGVEILTAESDEDVVRILRETPDDARRALGVAARARVLAEHTAEHRARSLERYVDEVRGP